MGKHNLLYQRETGAEVVFKCSACSVEIGFASPGLGEPFASLPEPKLPRDPLTNEWQTPENPDQWMTPCDGVDRAVLATKLTAGGNVSLSAGEAAYIAKLL